MDGARLEVVLEPVEAGYRCEWGRGRWRRVATNPGMPVSPLRDAASGGELAIMLALSGLGGGGGTATRAFDEIDAGVGGATARAVGRAAARAGGRRAGALHHAPPAGRGPGRHPYSISRVAGGATVAEVDAVAGEELVAEIVRIPAPTATLR